MKKISYKGVIVGAIADVLGTNIWGFLAIAYLSAKYHVYSLPQADQMTRIYSLLSQDMTIRVLNIIIGGGFTILGGYIAARIAKKNGLLNGTLASFLCVIFALFSIGSSSVLDVVIGIIANPVLGLAGGYLALWQKGKKDKASEIANNG